MNFLNYWKCILFLGISIQFSNGLLSLRPRLTSRVNNHQIYYDILVFSQKWPKVACYQWKQKLTSNACYLPNKNTGWTIHGLWPNKYNQNGPYYCSKNLPFNISNMSDLTQELSRNWINKQQKLPEEFWKHEWEKHGTCIAVIDRYTQRQYFQKGLQLYYLYNMNNLLKKVQIVSGRQYPLQIIRKRLHSVLKVNAQVLCDINERTKEQYLLEVRICFDKYYNLKDCNGIRNFPTNCDILRPVIYAQNLPQNHNVLPTVHNVNPDE